MDSSRAGPTELAFWLDRWELIPDGAAFSTPSSMLAPVRHGGQPAMLKIAMVPEEALGNRVMSWWAGRGAAAVLEHDGAAVVLRRAVGTRSLGPMARGGGDDAASRILCAAAGRLHGVDGTPPFGLPRLDECFAELFLHAQDVGGFFSTAAAVAADLLADQREIVVLHGDVHHGNVLDFGGDGWLAIDPKGIIGDRAFDFANIFCNPTEELATRPGRLASQIDVVATAAELDPERLVRWIVAWCGLSATWSARANDSSAHARAVGEAAERLLRVAR